MQQKALLAVAVGAMVVSLCAMAHAQRLHEGTGFEDIRDPQLKSLFNAASTGDVKSMRAVLADRQNLVWQTRPADGKTALHIAVMNGKYDACKLLLEEGADPKARDKHGKTALYYAWKTPYPGFVRLLRNADGKY